MTSETEQPTSSPTAAERKDLYSYRNVKSPNHSGKLVLLGWISQTSNAKKRGPINIKNEGRKKSVYIGSSRSTNQSTGESIFLLQMHLNL